MAGDDSTGVGPAGGDDVDGAVDFATRAREELGYSRWLPLLAAGAMGGVVGPYQYVWSSIEGPISRSLAIPLPQLGLTFTLFVLFQAGSQFPVGWWRDRHGPRGISVLAALLAGGGYVGLAYAETVWQLYLLYSLGAIGVGIVYTVAVNTALKWFPDRRGLTAGIATMAFAGGSALFIPYVRANATVSSYPAVLRTMGALILVVLLVGAYLLRDPPADLYAEAEEALDGAEASESAHEPAGARHYTWREVLRTWQFWLMYAMFVGVSAAGLMVTAKVVSFAQANDLAAIVATAAATLIPVAGGVGRVVLGEVSDRVDRRYAMLGSFVVCGAGIVVAVVAAAAGATLVFVGAIVVSVFFWSAQYTLFPSVVADFYGERESSANYALLYSGKVWGGVFGGAVAAWLVTRTDWQTTFLVGAAMAVLAGLGALALRAPPDAPSA